MKKEFYKLVLVAIMIVFAFSLGFFLGREVTLAQPRQVHSGNTPSPRHNNIVSKKSGEGSYSFAPPKSQREKVKEYKKNWLNKEGQQLAPPPVASPQKPLEQKKSLRPNPVITKPVLKESQSSDSAESGSRPQDLPPLVQDPLDEDKSPSPDHEVEEKQLKADSEVQKNPEKPANEPEKPANDKMYALHIKSHKVQENAMSQSTDLKLKFPRWRVFLKKTGKNYTVYVGPFKLKQSAQRTLRRLKNKKEFASARIEEIE